MKKQILVTEIEDLLISITNHFVDGKNNTNIDNVELEVIAVKITKLHEKIAVLKFLNDHTTILKKEENELTTDKANKMEALKVKSFEITPAINTPSNTKPVVLTEEPTPILPTLTTGSTNQTIVDVKKLMSINDRLLVQNQLFGNVAIDFTEFINKINAFANFTDAHQYFLNVQKEKSWKAEDETVIALTKFIYKKFNG